MSFTMQNLKSVLSLPCYFAIAIMAAPAAFAAAKTWDGGGNPNFNWSVNANWDLDTKPSATGDTLTFGGSTGLLSTNDSTVTSLTSTSFTFASGAGSFVLYGTGITAGNGALNDNFVTQASANNQTIALSVALAGGGRDRTIIMSGGGSLTLSGDINFNNDWLFPTTTAGTITLTGNNSGDGKSSAVIAGVNTMRAMMRNNVAGTQITLGSDTCLGNSGSGSISAGTASFRGIVANQQLNIGTTGGNRNLSGSTLAINANNITFNGANNLTIGNIINQLGNRDFVVSSSGQVTVSDGICLSADQTGRNLFLNLSGAGGMVVNGKIYDTFHSSGLTTSGSGQFRKAGSGTLTLNGASSYADTTSVEAGTLVLGNASAIGTGPLTLAGGNLDSSVANLVNANNNVQNWNNNFTFVGSQSLNLGTGAVTPSSSRQVTVSANTLTVGGVIGGGAIILTKVGGGTLSLNGNNTFSGGAIISGGTLQVGHANALGTGSSTVNGGTLDLNGYSVANTVNVTGSSTLANSSGTAGGLSADANLTADLTVNATGNISATRFIGTGAIRTITKDGAGTLTTSGTSHNNLSAWVINSGTVVLANTSGYGADRGVTISGGTLKLSGANFDLINDGQTFTVNGGVFDLNGKNEAVASIGGTGGFVHNGVSSTASTLYVGGGPGGTSSASYAGVIENGSGTLALTKEGNGIQTLAGTNTYTGNTTISASTLALSGGGSISATPLISVTNGAIFDVSALSSPFALGAGQTLSNNAASTGTLNGNAGSGSGTISLTYASGTPALLVTNGTLTLSAATVFKVNNTGSQLAAGSYKIISKATSGNAGAVAGTLPSVTVSGGGAAAGVRLQLVSGELYLVVNHAPVVAPLTVTRTAGLSLKVFWTDLTNQWSDVDGDAVTLAGLNLTSTNGVTVTTNGLLILYPASASNVADQLSYSLSDGQGGTATGLINIAVSSSVTGTNSIAGITGTNPKTVTAYGIPGYSYILERSTNLAPALWVSVATNTAATNGVISAADAFNDLGGTPPASAYYRLKWHP